MEYRAQDRLSLFKAGIACRLAFLDKPEGRGVFAR